MKQTQADKVLFYMKSHGSITPLDAVKDIGCMRLAARISDLKKKGYIIKTDIKTVCTRDGTAKVASYSLVEE